MSIREISWEEVVQAGTVLFGPGFATVAQAGGWRDDLKRAYRLRVLETHPDRAAALGRHEAELVREFRAVAEAYELLAQLRAGPLPLERSAVPPAPQRARPAARPAAPPATKPEAARRPPTARAAAPSSRTPPRPAPRPTPRPAPRSAAGGADRQAAPPPPVPPPSAPPPTAPRAASPTGGPLPRRRVRMAEFLYYSGQVAWRDFVAAIAWQRNQRPAVGRIAIQFGFLDRADVTEILERRRREGAASEPFGEFAVRRGYLSPYQLLVMLGQQLRLQRPIGRYFVERGLVGEVDLDDARVAVFRHNLRHLS